MISWLKHSTALAFARCAAFVLAAWLGAGAVRAEERIWITAAINGKSANLCFDTGADRGYLFSDGAARLNVPVRDIPISDTVNGEATPLRLTKECRVEVYGNVIQTSFAVINTSGMRASEVDGVIGWPILKNNLMRVEAKQKAVVFLAELPKDVANWTKLNIDTNSDLLRLEVPNSGEAPSLLLIDTGSEYGVSLPSARWREWSAAHSKEPVTLRSFFTPGVGLVVTEERWARRISVGPVVMSDVPVSEGDKGDAFLGTRTGLGTLGMAALRQLDFILDGKNNAAYLRTKETPAAEYKHNQLGAVFMPPNLDGGDLTAQVIEGSPAWKAGVRNGDVLLRIGNQDVTKWRTDPTIIINDNWQMPAGTKFKLTLRRGTKEFTNEVVLKQILRK